jgi:hypothetical protein
MKKKISVISLILIFFVSTTGLPLTINICSLMDTPEADMCEMHSEHKTCEYEAHKVSIKTEITKEDCCKTELIDKSICDKYLQINNQNNNLNHNTVAVISDDFSLNNGSLINPVKYFNDTSPPSLLNNHIYLNNSILLI